MHNQSSDGAPRLGSILCLAAAGVGIVVLAVTAAAVMLAEHDRVQTADVAKVLIALVAGTLTLIDGVVVAFRSRIPNALKAAGGAVLAVAAVVAYFNAFQFAYPHFFHRWEFFHSYIGAKYYAELGPERLYGCTIVAQDELGTVKAESADGRSNIIDMAQEARHPKRTIRDLETGGLVGAMTALEDPDACKRHFEPERWEDFKGDIRFFRVESQRSYFEDMQKGHGYGMSPVWTLGARLLVAISGTPSIASMKLLAFLDLVFLLGVFGALWWAFGWRVSTTAAIFWGCQSIATFYWSGGAFLRQEWLFFLVLSICLLRKRYPKLAGAAFAYTVLLEWFTVLIAIGWLIHAVIRFARTRKPPRQVAAWLLGGAIATGVLVPTSLVLHGTSGWVQHVNYEVVHRVPFTNDMGMGTVLAHGYGDEPGVGRMKFSRDNSLPDPFATWKQMRTERLRSMLPVHFVALLAIGLLFGLAAWRIRSMWATGALSQVFIFGLVQLVCWNLPFLVIAAPLTRVKRWLEFLLFGLAASTQLIAISFTFIDDKYTAMSVAVAVFCFALLASFIPLRLTRGTRGTS